jgi:hypothetical protein
MQPEATWANAGRMKRAFTVVPADEAYEDLLRRTLARVPGDLGQLIYLASTRDYNTGAYHHDGLSARFSPVAAAAALERAHREAFYKVAALSLRDLLKQMEMYLDCSHQRKSDVIRAWRKLEPFRIAIPMNVNATAAILFTSNIRLALAILPQLPEQV